MIVLSTNTLTILAANMQNSLAHQGVTVEQEQVQKAIADSLGAANWNEIISISQKQDEQLKNITNSNMRYTLRETMIKDCCDLIENKVIFPGIDKSSSIAVKLTHFGAKSTQEMDEINKLPLSELTGNDLSCNIEHFPQTRKLLEQFEEDKLDVDLHSLIGGLNQELSASDALAELMRCVAVNSIKSTIREVNHSLAYYHSAFEDKKLDAIQFQEFVNEKKGDEIIISGISFGVMKEMMLLIP
ncbi:hypothetical protein [Vibrio owensii]|uniref:hypothetical protein n=1 Tax=Vibrio harveyi group TaxID=717610 RepID=UPI003CC68EC5